MIAPHVVTAHPIEKVGPTVPRRVQIDRTRVLDQTDLHRAKMFAVRGQRAPIDRSDPTAIASRAAVVAWTLVTQID